MEVQIKQQRSWIFTIYLAPISDKGRFTAWRGNHSSYRHGWVLRALWLGFVVRWGFVPYDKRKKVWVDFETVPMRSSDMVLNFLEEDIH